MPSQSSAPSHWWLGTRAGSGVRGSERGGRKGWCARAKRPRWRNEPHRRAAQGGGEGVYRHARVRQAQARDARLPRRARLLERGLRGSPDVHIGGRGRAEQRENTAVVAVLKA